MKRGVLVVAVVLLLAVLLLASVGPSSAQVPIPGLSPTPLPPPPVDPQPSPSPTEQPPPPPPEGGGDGAPPPTSGGTPSPSRSSPGPVPAPAVAAPPPLVIPDLVRSPSRTTARLLEIVAPLADRGLPIETAMIKAAPPFPVAGYSWFTDDWMFPRYIPTPHLHEGTDIIAESGTPIVASGPGVLAAMNTTPVGGNIIWIVGDDGNAIYYAHLLSFGEGLQAGQRVEMGTVIGYVGNTGNAIGSVPHVHLEIHPAIRDRAGRIIDSGVNIDSLGFARSRTPPTNPKPYLDQWLVQAEARAQEFVVQYMQRVAGMSRQIHFSNRIDDIFQTDSLERPDRLATLAAFDPTLGILGLARQGVLSTPQLNGRTAEERSLEEQRLAAVKFLVESPKIKWATLTGGFERRPGPLAPPAG